MIPSTSFTALIKFTALALCLILCQPLFAATESTGHKIVPFKLKDQFNKEHSIDSSLRLILFTKSKSANTLVVEALAGKSQAELDSLGVKYVADISGMPTLIYKWFALPKMKKYTFSVLVDEKPQITQQLPSKEDHVSLIYLDNLTQNKVVFLKSVDEIKSAVENMKQ